MVVAAPMSYSGNNALALDPWAAANRQHLSETAIAEPSLFEPSLNDTQDLPLLRGQNPVAWSPSTSRVIPFDQIPRPGVRATVPQPPPVQVSSPPVRPTPPQQAPQQKKRPAGPPVEQATLDFTTASAPPARNLKTGVPASNYCQRPVASLLHRFSAALADFVMIVSGFILCGVSAQLAGMAVGAPEVLGSGKAFFTLMGAFALIMTGFYGMLWLFARRETAGMRMVGLELITFDNSPLDPATRMVRMITTWVSLGALGLGVIWAVADEEKLTWHDHISKSFPTFRDDGDSFVTQHAD